MTDKPTPTDAEILDAAEDFRSHYTHGGTTFDEFDEIGFARAVLAKWGQPAQAVVGGKQVYQASYKGGFWQDSSRERHEYLKTPGRSLATDWELRVLYTAPQPVAQAGAVTDAQVLAAVRVLSPSLFRHGLQPLPHDGANTAAQMRKEADTVRKMLEAANGIKGGQHVE